MKKIALLMLAGLMALSGSACGQNTNEPVEINENMEEDTSEMTILGIDHGYTAEDGVNVIYLAGGCFWGTEKLMQSMPGVLRATSGYANGKTDTPTYEAVVTGATGYRETVRVEYDPDLVSLDTILFVFFDAIDPTVKNAQGNDVGTQYQTGVYYIDDAAKEAVDYVAGIEKERAADFFVEIGLLQSFWDAEDYHQDYLDNNPYGYCHISLDEFERAQNIIVDAAAYRRPAEDVIKEMLTDLQYHVTQDAGTEVPFDNTYWDNHEKGIYVDIVTGEPLFSSADKFDSGTGWPSFSKPIDENTLVLMSDDSLGMQRTEARSRAGNSHLGHVFYGETGSPTDTRYCINSAALSFIPYKDMAAKGYEYLTAYVS